MLLCNHQQQAIIFLAISPDTTEYFCHAYFTKQKHDFTSILLTFGKLPASYRCVFYTDPHLLLERSDSQTRGLTVCQKENVSFVRIIKKNIEYVDKNR